ncbi:MAG: Rieske 2Fe-2S domain-containing protein [Methanotrichaceae archaeon]|nr:Rieske 2Fe-2S domain-containing protein [Methanotrichaceae archaeon]
MTDFIGILRTDELKNGTMKKIDVAGHKILVARVGERYYATDNSCPHMGGDLSKGTLKGTIVTCPRHHAQFDLTDGHVVRWTDWSGLKLKLAKIVKPPRPLKIHEITIDGDKILYRPSK